MSDITWVSKGYGSLHGNGLSNLFLKISLEDLATAAARTTLSGVIWKNFTEYCRAITWYPINVNTLNKLNMFGDSVELHLGYELASLIKLGVYGRPALNANYTRRIDIGTCACPAINGDYRDYEPLSSYELYIPFYGFAGLKAADVVGQTLKLSMCLDWSSGQGTYYLENDTRLIGKYTAQIGAQIPFGQTGASDAARNLILGAVKSGAAIASASVAPLLGANVINYESTQTNTGEDFSEVRSQYPETGRLRKSGETRKQYSRESTRRGTTTSNSWRGRAASACFDGAASAIANIQFHPQIDRSNNPASDAIGSVTPVLIIRQGKVRDADAEYRTLFGLPYGKTVKLSDVSGYTKCSTVKLTAANFGTITAGELSLIEQQLLNGVIFTGEYVEALRAPSISTTNSGAWFASSQASINPVLEVTVGDEVVYSETMTSNEVFLTLAQLGVSVDSSIGETLTVKARLLKNGYIASDYATATWTIYPYTTKLELVNFNNQVFSYSSLQQAPIVTVTVTDTGFTAVNEDGVEVWDWTYEGEYKFVGMYTKDLSLGIGSKTYASGESFELGGVQYNVYAEIWCSFEIIPRLDKPTNVTITEDGLLSWAAVDNATSYNIYADNTILLGTVNFVSANITTLDGYSQLNEGEPYSIGVVATAEGYLDSYQSDTVGYTIQPTYLLSGGYIINSTITPPTFNATFSASTNIFLSTTSNSTYYSVSILANPEYNPSNSAYDSYIVFKNEKNNTEMLYYLSNSSVSTSGSAVRIDLDKGSVMSTYTNELTRTVYFSGTEVTKEVYDWFTANTTPKS